jgi:hypothetical protein
MNRRALYSLSAHPFWIWSELTFKTDEMMLASAQVIGHRTNRTTQAGPSPSARDQGEFALMGQEKIQVANESAQAMAISMIRLNPQFGPLAFKQMLTGATAMMCARLTARPGNRWRGKPDSFMTAWPIQPLPRRRRLPPPADSPTRGSSQSIPGRRETRSG